MNCEYGEPKEETELESLQKAGILQLSPREALNAMLDGATLVNEDGIEVKWNAAGGNFIDVAGKHPFYAYGGFKHLRFKKTRPMTRLEILAWAQNPESRGWLVNVRYKGDSALRDDWQLPGHYKYDNYEWTADDIFEYVRAPLSPDFSGVDETRMEKFEIEA